MLPCANGINAVENGAVIGSVEYDAEGSTVVLRTLCADDAGVADGMVRAALFAGMRGGAVAACYRGTDEKVIGMLREIGFPASLNVELAEFFGRSCG